MNRKINKTIGKYRDQLPLAKNHNFGQILHPAPHAPKKIVDSAQKLDRRNKVAPMRQTSTTIPLITVGVGSSPRLEFKKKSGGKV